MAAPIIQKPAKYWFADDYKGSTIDPNVGVVHTTEGTSLPWYDGGAKAPTYTGTPDFAKQRLVWTQHFPDTMSARALRNEAGGVETNTLNCLQIELVGTCDLATSKKWTAAGRQHIFWPDAPQWALDELAEFVALKYRELGIRIEGPEQVGKAWAAYPASYGKAASQRFSFAQWKDFYGWCGHEHVPENDHGDPGALPWAYVETKAKAIVAPKPPVEDDVTPEQMKTVADQISLNTLWLHYRLLNDLEDVAIQAKAPESALLTAKTAAALAAYQKKLAEMKA